MMEIFAFVKMIALLPLPQQLLCVFGIASSYQMLKKFIADAKGCDTHDN